jgi:hypothetical protein
LRDIFKIKLDINDVADFVKAATGIANDINLYQGYYVISGRSYLGILTLNLNKTIKMIVRDREDDKIVYETFNKWLVD